MQAGFGSGDGLEKNTQKCTKSVTILIIFAFNKSSRRCKIKHSVFKFQFQVVPLLLTFTDVVQDGPEKIFHVWTAGCSLWKAEGFSWSLEALFGGLNSVFDQTIQFPTKFFFFFSFLVLKNVGIRNTQKSTNYVTILTRYALIIHEE